MRHERISVDDRSFGYLSYLMYDNSRGADNRADRERMKKILFRAVKHELTERQRECLLMHYIEGVKMKDIAARLGLSKSTVSRHISAAERKLRRVAAYYNNFH